MSLNNLYIDKINLQYIKRIMIFSCFAYSNMRKNDPSTYIMYVNSFIKSHLKSFPVSYKIHYGPASISSVEEERQLIIDDLLLDEGADAYHIVTIYVQYPKGTSIIEFSIDLREENKLVDFLYL
jgi:hypothetical protein